MILQNLVVLLRPLFVVPAVVRRPSQFRNLSSPLYTTLLNGRLSVFHTRAPAWPPSLANSASISCDSCSLLQQGLLTNAPPWSAWAPHPLREHFYCVEIINNSLQLLTGLLTQIGGHWLGLPNAGEPHLRMPLDIFYHYLFVSSHIRVAFVLLASQCTSF